MNFPLTTYIQWKWTKKVFIFSVLWKWLRHQTTLHWLFSHHMTKKLSSKSTPKWKETSWFPSFMLDKPIYFLPTNLKKFLYADYIFIQDFWVAIGKHFNFFKFFKLFIFPFFLTVQPWDSNCEIWMEFLVVKTVSPQTLKWWWILGQKKSWNLFHWGVKMLTWHCFLAPEMRWWIIEKWWAAAIIPMLEHQVRPRLHHHKSIMYPVHSLRISCNTQKLLQGNA